MEERSPSKCGGRFSFLARLRAACVVRFLVNRAAGLGGTQNAGVRGYGVRGPVSAGPFGKTESAGGVDAVDGDVVIGERRFGLAEFGSAGGLHEVHGADAHHGGVAGAVDEQRGLFIDRNIARHSGPAIEIDAAHECEVTPHAIASDEMRIVEQAVHVGDADKIFIERDVAIKGIGQRLARCDSLAG
jgi:hypothetical protein